MNSSALRPLEFPYPGVGVEGKGSAHWIDPFRAPLDLEPIVFVLDVSHKAQQSRLWKRHLLADKALGCQNATGFFSP